MMKTTNRTDAEAVERERERERATLLFNMEFVYSTTHTDVLNNNGAKEEVESN